MHTSALEIRTKKLGAKVAPNSEKLGATRKSWGPSYWFWLRFLSKIYEFCKFSTPLCKISVDDVCERRRRERNFGYILREHRILMPFVTKRWGPPWPPSPKSWGPIQKDGGHWPLGPRLFPSLTVSSTALALSGANLYSFYGPHTCQMIAMGNFCV